MGGACREEGHGGGRGGGGGAGPKAELAAADEALGLGVVQEEHGAERELVEHLGAEGQGSAGWGAGDLSA